MKSTQGELQVSLRPRTMSNLIFGYSFALWSNHSAEKREESLTSIFLKKVTTKSHLKIKPFS